MRGSFAGQSRLIRRPPGEGQRIVFADLFQQPSMFRRAESLRAREAFAAKRAIKGINGSISIKIDGAQSPARFHFSFVPMAATAR
jgi:hypothetical protein